MAITRFGRSRSPVSLQADHPFRTKPITHFGRSRSPGELTRRDPTAASAAADAASEALRAFAASPWGQQYPTIVASWERAWPYVTPFFVFPPAVRKLIYTTNAIESLHMRLRKIIKTRGHFPTDEAASKLLWLAIRNATKTTVRSAHAWHEAMNQFAIFFGERFTHPQR